MKIFHSRRDARCWEIDAKDALGNKKWTSEDIEILDKIEESSNKDNKGSVYFPWGLNVHLQRYMIEQYKARGKEYLNSMGKRVIDERRRIKETRES